MTIKEKLDVLQGEIAASTSKLVDIERRLDEIGNLVTRDVSGVSQKLAEFNVRLSSVAANVLEVSAVAARASEMVNKPEKKSELWTNHQVELKK
jgi:hypothetical protein